MNLTSNELTTSKDTIKSLVTVMQRSGVRSISQSGGFKLTPLSISVAPNTPVWVPENSPHGTIMVIKHLDIQGKEKILRYNLSNEQGTMIAGQLESSWKANRLIAMEIDGATRTEFEPDLKLRKLTIGESIKQSSHSPTHFQEVVQEKSPGSDMLIVAILTPEELNR